MPNCRPAGPGVATFTGMRRWIGLISILLGFSLPVCASESKEIALHIAVIDHMAFSEAAFTEVETFLTEALPSVTVRSVKVESSVFHENRDALRAQLLEQLSGFRPDDRITHLIIDTHGDTRDGQTKLAVLGNFGADGADADLRAILEPLRSHLTPDLTIVLNSCSTLCGGDASIRVRGLLTELGVPDARVYGSVVPEVEKPGALIGRPQWLAHLGDLAQLKLFITIGVALGAPFAYATDGSYVGSIAAATASIYALTVAMKAAMARFGAVNLGRLMIFKNGALVEDRPVDKFGARFEIYGTCSALFR